MKRLLLCLCPCAAHMLAPQVLAPQVLAPPELELGRNSTAAQNAFLELTTPRTIYFVQEPIQVRLRFGFEQGFLRDSMVQMFPQALDVPVQLVAPWIENLPGALVLAPVDGQDHERLATFALDDGVARARRAQPILVEGRSFAVFEIERSYLARSAGELVLPRSELRFAYATRFEEDFVHGRLAVDRVDASVSGAGLALRIQPLPEEARPLEFGGAVGRFTLRAQAEPRDLERGRSLELVLHIEGAGNLGFFPAPSLDGLAGFHVQGKLEDVRAAGLRVAYDLVPRDERVEEVPPVRFAYFDPGPPAGYRVLETPPIPILVRPARKSGSEVVERSDAQADPVRSAADEGAPRPARGPGLVLALALLLVLAALALRRRRRGGADPTLERVRGAAAAFRARSSAPDTDPSQPLAEFLAAALDCPPAAVFTPALPARLSEAGVPDELAGRTAALLDGLIAARYGGQAQERGLESARALVEELALSFLSARAGKSVHPASR